MDHFPLMLDGGVSRRSGYFKFMNMWLKSEGFVEQVNHGGCPIIFRVTEEGDGGWYS
jgi:hypothetical protein